MSSTTGFKYHIGIQPWPIEQSFFIPRRIFRTSSQLVCLILNISALTSCDIF